MSIRNTLLLLTVAIASTEALADRGYLGVGLAVDGDGFFLNPTLRSVKIANVIPNSPAAKAGISVGDVILEIEGRKIAGAKANEVKPYLEREVGKIITLVIQKPTGDKSVVAVTLGPKL